MNIYPYVHSTVWYKKPLVLSSLLIRTNCTYLYTHQRGGKGVVQKAVKQTLLRKMTTTTLFSSIVMVLLLNTSRPSNNIVNLLLTSHQKEQQP